MGLEEELEESLDSFPTLMMAGMLEGSQSKSPSSKPGGFFFAVFFWRQALSGSGQQAAADCLLELGRLATAGVALTLGGVQTEVISGRGDWSKVGAQDEGVVADLGGLNPKTGS
jgi:hypothetical protein